jgi:hypothetical protein
LDAVDEDAAEESLTAGEEKVKGFAAAFKALPVLNVGKGFALALDPFAAAPPNEKRDLLASVGAEGADWNEKGEGVAATGDGKAGAPASFFFGNPRIGLEAIDAAEACA